MAETATRPKLTLPEAEASALRAAYAAAEVVLEYGSGGSTVLAAEAGAEVWAVESDAGLGCDDAALVRNEPGKGQGACAACRHRPDP